MGQFERLVDELIAGVEGLAEELLRRLGERSPGWEVESAFSRRQAMAVARSSLESQLRAFRRDELPRSAPEADDAAARALARVGELRLFAPGYRAAQLVLWEAWFGLVEDDVELSTAQRRILLARGSSFFFRYADLLSDQVAAIYRSERAVLGAGNGDRRFRAVRALLADEPPAVPSPDLDLDLDQRHLGLLAWGPGGDTAARELAAGLARPLLLVTPLERTWWGWISGRQPFEAAELRAIESFEPTAGAGLAVGLQEFGARGFRATHRQAQRARIFAPPGTSTLTRYADVAVEAIASENEEEARSFVERELGAIGDDTVASRRIRETIAAYFAAGHNAASAAATLGIHEQTVANRLRTAEERLGHPIGARRVELELALRLRASLMRDPQDS
jgi:hypothetical protein